ncbi:MAG: glycosyltransferase [Thermodesulfobacteriota bacterium]
MGVTYSIIIPAYNEENWLPRTLTSLKTAMAACGLAGEVIVVDNNSTDSTAQIAAEYGARIIFEPRNQISRARNAGADAAGGDYLIFLDADTLLPPDLLKSALKNLADGACCGGGAWVSSIEAPPAAVLRSIELWNRLSRAFNWAAGCFIYTLRQGFEAVGGFSEKVYASEEIWFSRQLRAWGKSKGLTFRIIKHPPIATSVRKLHWFTPRQALLLIILMIFPLALRSRLLCAYWYVRPAPRK